MKFETPKMNISMFAVENVVTASGAEELTNAQKQAAAAEYAKSNVHATANVLEFTF